jgi:hypothetical protein
VFLIGINEGLCLGSVIDAGVSTIFVGLGEDPMYVQNSSSFSSAYHSLFHSLTALSVLGALDYHHNLFPALAEAD